MEKALLDGKLMNVVQHPNQKKYTNQKIMYIEIEKYIYCVPFVEYENKFFLKTIYPSRKLKKLLTEKNI